jgi:hypothetical protein
MYTLKKYWCFFWYRDVTRLLFIMVPSYFILLIPFLVWVGLPSEYMKDTLVFVYILGFAWAMCDNDYSKLRKYGRDEYHRPLKS